MKKKYISFISKTGVLLSIALIIGYFESLLPPLIPFIPYFRIGLSNIVLIIALLRVNILSAYVISVLKSFIVPLFVGNPSMILYSLPSSFISLSIMIFIILIFYPSLSSASAISALIHNFVQILVAYFIMETKIVFTYLPYLSIMGIVAGILTGILAYWINKTIVLHEKKL